MKKISLMEICAYLIGAFFVVAFWTGNAHSQSVPFNAYSVQTLGGNCTQQGSVMTQTANGRSICLGTGGNGQVLKSNGAGADVSWATVSGVGTVTSVGLTAPGQFSVANSPITAAGTLALSWQNQTANTVLAGPSSGAAAAPTFRALVGDDLPNPTSTKKGGVVSSSAPTNQFATGVNTSGVVTYARPAFSNLSGQASSAQIAAGAAVANLGYTPLNPANNLSDVSSVSTARTNLAVPGTGVANSFSGTNAFTNTVTLSSGILSNDQTAPTTAANQGAVYVKDSGTQSELFYRTESNGAEVQLTANGGVNASYSQYAQITTATYDFNIPAWAKNISIGIYGLNTSTSNSYGIQLGDSGGIKTTGYLGQLCVLGGTCASHGNGFGLTGSISIPIYGTLNLTKVINTAGTWAISGSVSSASLGYLVSGGLSMTNALTTIRIQNSGGALFAGYVSISVW